MIGVDHGHTAWTGFNRDAIRPEITMKRFPESRRTAQNHNEKHSENAEDPVHNVYKDVEAE